MGCYLASPSYLDQIGLYAAIYILVMDGISYPISPAPYLDAGAVASDDMSWSAFGWPAFRGGDLHEFILIEELRTKLLVSRVTSNEANE